MLKPKTAGIVEICNLLRERPLLIPKSKKVTLLATNNKALSTLTIMSVSDSLITRNIFTVYQQDTINIPKNDNAIHGTDLLLIISAICMIDRDLP